MDEQDVKSLAVKLAAVTDRIEKRLDAVARGTMQATQAMEQQARQALAASEQVSAGVRRAAADALQHGTTEAIDRFGGVVRASERRLEDAAERLERRMLTVGKWQVAFAWKAFAASALGSFALIGVAAYVIWEAREAARVTRWVKQVNAAQAAGRLGACPAGGEHVCAKVDKRWVRLDP
ncbi:hypothetical protein [Luteibacter yeojuensis]|uniref:Relaxation protein n=1 Tax=Luteibacter yeojuensis TaxID=345309 RepID=A0A0F3L1L8_9GAMM|nr:hypothetical protein [Luteibacter yeojuensis]KJV37373.1 hypothetical protein VI08_00755 [Luteibacter yeojuensis]